MLLYLCLVVLREISSIIFIFLLVSSLNYSNIKKGFQGDKIYQFDKAFVKEI